MQFDPKDSHCQHIHNMYDAIAMSMEATISEYARYMRASSAVYQVHLDLLRNEMILYRDQAHGNQATILNGYIGIYTQIIEMIS